MIKPSYLFLDGPLPEHRRNRYTRSCGEPWSIDYLLISQFWFLICLKNFVCCHLLCNLVSVLVSHFVWSPIVFFSMRYLLDPHSGDCPWAWMFHVPLQRSSDWGKQLELGMCALLIEIFQLKYYVVLGAFRYLRQRVNTVHWRHTAFTW